MATKKATIRDVAQEAGVSLGTASRALNNRGAVSSAALAAVKRAADRLGYQPDLVAKSMRGQAMQSIGVLVSDIGNPLYARIFVALEQRLQADGYSVLLANTHNDPRRELELVRSFARHRVSGAFIGPCASESDILKRELAAMRAVVALDRDMDSMSDAITVDHFGASFRATRHLLNLGHTRIALLTPSNATRPGRERIAGYQAAHAERGLCTDVGLIRAEPSATEFSFSECLALLSSANPPTAFLCLGTRLLAGALKAIKQTALCPPEDVSVISIGDSDLAQLHEPAITTVMWDLETVGITAAELLLKRLAAGDIETQRVVLTPELVLRESCGTRRAVRQKLPAGSTT